MDYKQRNAEAKSVYEQGKKRAKEGGTPEGQKFPIGSRVHICKDLGQFMSHFTSDCDATVEYTYEQAYGNMSDDPERHSKTYSLIIDGHGSSAWYEEWQLTAIKKETP